MCATCGSAAKAAKALAEGKVRAWQISLADGTTATVSSENEADRERRKARARMAQKGYTARRS